MIQFNADEVASLVMLTRRYKEYRGSDSDYMYQRYSDLENKLLAYYEEVNLD